MFPGPGHFNHSSIWMVPSPACRNTVSCIACLLDVLNTASLSQVQKQMNLDLLNSLVNESETTLHLFTENLDICYHIINQITEMCTDEPHRLTSVSLCVAMVHRLQDETVYEILMDKFKRSVLEMCSEKKIQFFSLVFDKLCEVSLMYAKILLSSQMDAISHLLSYQEFLEVDTMSYLARLLVHLMKALQSSPEQLLKETDSFLWQVMEILVTWLNTAVNKSFQANCLALLRELLQLQDVPSGLLLIGQNNQEGHSLLMGIKRILVTKDEELVFSGTQCLTGVMDNLSGSEYIKEVFDTDLAEFVFELLHTSNASKLDCVFQCLLTMASHRLFFDKCHAVYGLDSTLLAVQQALGSERFVTVEIGLSLLTRLMEGQPECMPLFVNHSWSKTCQLLDTCLQHRKLSLFVAALKATQAFLRTQHQQSPVDVSSVTTLLRTASSQSEQHLKTQLEQGHSEEIFRILSIISDIVLANVELIAGDDILCGNLEDQIQELKATVMDVCGRLVLPQILKHWHYLNNSTRVEKFLACLDFHMSADRDDQQTQLAQLMATGLPCQILCLPLQSDLSDDTRRLMGHVLAGMCLQLATYIKPSLLLSEETLIAGFSRLNWWEVQSGKKGADKICCKEEVVAWFCVTYFSWLMGFRTWPVMDIHTFLERMLDRHPDLLSYGMVVARAFVYLQAICQTGDVAEDIVRCDPTESHLMAYLKKSAVETWFTEDPAVFRWSVLTESRTSTIGVMMVEYWLLHLVVPSCPSGLNMAILAEDKKEVLFAVRQNYGFLHCLVVLLKTHAVAGPARDVLIYCISSLPVNKVDTYHMALYEDLFNEVSQEFEALFVQTTEINASLSVNMLPVLCELLECPFMSAGKMTSFKSIYYAVKLAGMSTVQDAALAWTLKYLSCVTSCMSVQDSKTVILPLIKDDKFLEVLQHCINSSDTSTSAAALSLSAWLATTEHQYQASRPIVVTSDFLLSSLASCKHGTSLPVLKLLNIALSKMSLTAASFNRCVQFVKKKQNFVSTRVFSARELQQVYLYLQQFVVKDDVVLRSAAVQCMKTLFNTDPDIYLKAHSHPWNSLMLESVLTARTHCGLTDAELELCLLFVPSIEKTWMGNAANSFLLALLSSDLTASQLDRADSIVEQIRQLPGVCDPEILATVDEFLSTHPGRASG